MAISIADKVAALRAARKPAQQAGEQPRIILADGTLSIHDAVFETELTRAGRTDIENLMRRPVEYRDAILALIEHNPNIVLKWETDL